MISVFIGYLVKVRLGDLSIILTPIFQHFIIRIKSVFDIIQFPRDLCWI